MIISETETELIALIRNMERGDRIEIQMRPNECFHIVLILDGSMTVGYGAKFESAWKKATKSDN